MASFLRTPRFVSRPLDVWALAIFLGGAWWFRRFSIDDAFITYRYARNWAEGRGPVMNAGERVEGISNLPWAALLASCAELGGEPHRVAPILGLLFGILCLVLVGRLSRAAGLAPTSGAWAMRFAAVWAPLSIWGIGGLETNAYAFFLLVATILLLEHVERARTPWLPGAAYAWVASMRPEGFLFVFPALFHVARRRSRVAALSFLAAFVVCLLPLVLGRLIYYGDWLPNPVYAKAGGLALQPGLVYAGKILVAYPMIILAAWWNRNASSALQLLSHVLLTQWLFAIVVGGERFPGYRFWAPVIPVAAVFLQAGLWRAVVGGGPSRWSRVLAVGAGLLGLAGLLWPGVLQWLVQAVFVWVRTYETSTTHTARLLSETRFFACMILAAVGIWAVCRWRGVFDHEIHRCSAVLCLAVFLLSALLDPSIRPCRQPDPAAELGRQVGIYLRENLPAESLIATNAAGALPYYSRLPTLDMLGLTDAHIARGERHSGQWAGHEKGDGRYVLSRRPDIVIFGGPEGSLEPWPFRGDAELWQLEDFQRHYDPVQVPLQGFEFTYYRKDPDWLE